MPSDEGYIQSLFGVGNVSVNALRGIRPGVTRAGQYPMRQEPRTHQRLTGELLQDGPIEHAYERILAVNQFSVCQLSQDAVQVSSCCPH